MEHLDAFIKELLHLDDVRGNRLLDVGDLSGNAVGAGAAKAYRLFAQNGQNCRTMLQVIASRRGKPSNKTVLNNSAIVRSTVETFTEKWDWADLSGSRDVKALDKFISEVYNALDLKGNNPLFLGVGCLSWSIACGDEIKKVNSPLLIFPIRFVRGTNTSPVEIEFVDDDAYFNPCLIGRMEQEYPEQIAANFPHPNGMGAAFDEAIDLNKLGDGEQYMNKVAECVSSLCPADGDNALSFDKDIITVAQYNHSDICMYYDVRRNKQKIYAHPLVRRIFGGDKSAPAPAIEQEIQTRPILPVDSVQEKIISKVAAGQSLIVKGPPGTGKTLTIANMIATLLSRGKSVLVASEKLSALAEVHAKLPENLRKFVMLLDYETEQKAAAGGPAEVRAEFKRLIKYKKEYVYDSANDLRQSRADREKAEAMIELAKYCEDMFGDDVAFGSYYDALDAYFKGADLPVVNFTDNGSAAAISRESYNKLLLTVKDCAAHYAHLAADGDISLSPWLGVTEKTDTERALVALCDIADCMSDILHTVKCEERDLDCTYGDMHDGALTKASPVDIRKILLKLTARDGELLEMLTDRYELAKAKADTDKFVFNDGVTANGFADILDIKYAENVKLSTVKVVAKNSDLFIQGEGISAQAAAKLTEVINNIGDIRRERDGLAADVMFVLDKAQSGDVQLLKACAAISPYASGEKQSIGLFDFKAKSAEKKLRNVCSRTDITLKELALAAQAYARINECDGKLSGLLGVLSHVVGRDALTKEQADCIFTVAELSKSLGVDMQTFVSSCVAAAQSIAAIEGLVKTPDDYAVGELICAVKFMYAKAELITALGALCQKSEINLTDDALRTAQSISAVLRIYASPVYKGDVDGVIGFVERMQNSGEISSKIAAVVNKLKVFGDKYFVNAYARAPWFVTPKSTRTFIAQAKDRSMLHAALIYGEAAHSGLLSPFFDSIENGEVKVGPDRFTELFVHSYLSLVIENKLSALGTRRNGLCKNAELALKNFISAENEIYACNAKRTENLCLARINADDDDFDFLSVDKGKAMSLRSLFKAQANAILKLKRCFIMSPSTASVLFRGEAYENFDVVIVDEASQMEPVDMLPVLYRSKQCVLVGDEFQMPPLTHFKTKNRKRISDPDSELTLDTDISALSLALGNLAFDAEELVCHYRSNTEALIEFSQREFYPYMRTFPATVPATPDLGFTDVLTADGYCEDGVNPVEAEAVIKALHEHFDKYYDKATGVLKMSVGVVTFGEAQLKHVINLVRADKKLFDCIETAWRNYNDVPDKLVFFRTIESVQGQETEHLILSLTYGRDKNKNIKLAFGELNRDATGKNIFNVAVTRAKCRVTVIHTLTAQQMLGNPRIAFIQSYLSGVERYALIGRNQFVSEAPEKGESFVAAVAEYIKSLGVEESRIVTNYGVTEGSVRIPIAVLSKDLTRAELGVWCEYPVLKKYDFFDYNARYVSSLVSRGWVLHKAYCHDWFDNTQAEKASLKAAVQKHVTK